MVSCRMNSLLLLIYILVQYIVGFDAEELPMKIKEIMSKSLIFVEPDEALSAALTKMRKNNIHQLLVMDGKNLLGMVELKKVVTKNVDITKTKVEKLITPTSSISQDATIEEGAKLLLDSGLRAVPVMEKEEIVGVISETDLIKTVSSKKRANEIATPCEYVELEDTMGKIMEIMLAKNVSRVPVVQNGKLIGVVGTMDMIKLLEAKEPIKDKYVAAEKLQLEDIKVKTLMTNPYIADANTPVDRLKDTLVKSEEVFLQDDEIKIITPKDLLELLIEKPKRGAYVQITNLGDEAISVTAKIDKITDTFIKKTASLLQNIEFLFIHIERHQKQGKKIKYSVRARFSTNLGLFVAHDWGWDLVSTMQSTLSNLEREVIKKHDILRNHSKEKLSKGLRKNL